MDFEDVKKIFTAVEPEIKDTIDIIGLLPYLKLSKHIDGQIRAQAKQQGEPYASSLFFNTLRSHPKKFKTLVAALFKIGQSDIAKVLIKQTRKHFKTNGDQLKQVLEEIDAEKRKLCVEDSESGSDPDEPGNDRGNRPGRAEPSAPKSESGSPSTQSPDSNTDQPFTSIEAPRPDTSVIYRRQPIEPSAGGRDSGSDRRLSSLKTNFHRQLAKELEKENKYGDQNWVTIAESETIDLNLTDEDMEKIENSPKPGTVFLRTLKGYTLGRLTWMFEQVNMQEAINLIRRNENTVAMPDDQSIDNNLNMAGSRDNRDESLKTLNIESGKEGPEKQFYPLPAATNENKRNNSGGELQPIQVSSSRSSLSDNGSYSSSPCSSNTNLSDINLKEQQAVQSVGDPSRESSAPNPSMEALKLREDVTHPALNVTQDSFKDLQKTQQKDQGDVGIEFTVGQDSQTTDNTRSNDRSTNGSNQIMNIPTTAVQAAESLPLRQAIDATRALTVDQVTSESMSTYSDTSTSDSAQFRNIPTTVGQTAESIPFSSYSMDGSATETIDDVSLKGTRALQPVTERDQVVPDQQREAEELRHDRIHALDDHPSALGSFADIKAENAVQGQNDDVAMATEDEDLSHEFRKSMAEPQLLEEEDEAAIGATGGSAEGGDSNLEGEADSKINTNIPDLSAFNTHEDTGEIEGKSNMG